MNAPHRQTRRRLPVRALLGLLLAVFLYSDRAGASGAQPWVAGAYSFSDELGGFVITGVSGVGTKTDPVVVEQEFLSASPVTLVIRAVSPIRTLGHVAEFATGFIHMRIESLNNSGLGWIEFEFELQEILGVTSVFRDGLSFDQRRKDTDNISSDRFRRYSRDFEPHDRLVFSDGGVDPMETAQFSFFITDFTPKSVFYLVQDPRVPSS